MHPHQHMPMQPPPQAKPEPTSEKKRKRPADMPRRPLSAYNFFFSEERVRVLAEIPDPAKSQEDIDAMKAAGVDPEEEQKKKQKLELDENGPEAAAKKSEATAERLLQIRDAKTVKRRPHRKSHGKIAFKDLAKTIGKRWRALTETGKVRYNQLAEKDLQRYNEQMKEYNTKRNRYSYQTTPGPLPPQLNAAVMNAQMPGGGMGHPPPHAHTPMQMAQQGPPPHNPNNPGPGPGMDMNMNGHQHHPHMNPHGHGQGQGHHGNPAQQPGTGMDPNSINMNMNNGMGMMPVDGAPPAVAMPPSGADTHPAGGPPLDKNGGQMTMPLGNENENANGDVNIKSDVELQI
jgi:hypothetical protein